MHHNFESKQFGRIYVVKKRYGGGRMALQLVEADGTLAAVLTVNIPELDKLLRRGEFFVKTWSENEQISADALASGLFVDTGRRVKNGFVEAQIWRFSDEAL